jgi:hypothetical protein
VGDEEDRPLEAVEPEESAAADRMRTSLAACLGGTQTVKSACDAYLRL